MDAFQHALSLIASIAAALPQPEGAGLAAKSQDELDRATKQVADVADGVRRFKVVDVGWGVEQFAVQHAVFNGSESLDVYVDVLQSAQQAALYVNLGGWELDLSGQTASLVLRIGGAGGVREFTFSSGTHVALVADVIDNFGPPDVTARLFSSGVILQTLGLSDQSFLSVQVIKSGGLETTRPTSGIYRMLADNAREFDPIQFTPIASTAALTGVTDHGQDVQGRIWATSPTVNITGPVTGHARRVWINRPRLRALIQLQQAWPGVNMGAGSQYLGTFKAFTIERCH